MTIKEIAALAGVSVSTVSKIMNGKDMSAQRSSLRPPDPDSGQNRRLEIQDARRNRIHPLSCSGQAFSQG